jgi:tetratricopeptide (TPR) repeat protein
MSHANGDCPTTEARLDDVVADYLEAVQAGRAPDRESILAEYPDLAAELEAFFADHDKLSRLADPLRAIAQAAQIGLEIPPLAGGSDGPRSREFGGYELLGELGHGGMGTVYRARQKGLNRIVALKRIITGPWATEAELQRFRQEAEAAALLDHPNIVPIYEVGEYQGHRYFTMKLIEGGSLAEHLARYRDDPQAAARLLVAVAQAVHHAHQRGLLHRDLKPSNILLDTQGRPHVTDFGLARWIGTGGELTLSGAIIGSPPYMAPEQATGRKGSITTATDIYGLGALLYAVLTGRPPFRGDTMLETLDRVRDQAPVPPSALNPRVDRNLGTICLKCLEKSPERRYGSAEDLAGDLERWLRGEPIAARAAGWAEHTSRWCRRNPFVAALIATVGVLLVGTVAALTAGLVVVSREKASTRAALVQARIQRRRAELNLLAALDEMNTALLTTDGDNPARRAGLTQRQHLLSEQALRFYRGLIARLDADPAASLEEGDIYVYMANVFRQRRERAEAVATYEKAIACYRARVEADPTDWEGWANLGQGYNFLGGVFWEFGRPAEAAGPFREAERAYRAAVQLAPGIPRALNYLAWFLAVCPDQRFRRPVEAVAFAGRAVELAPQTGPIWNTLGAAHYRAGRWEECLAALDRSIKLRGGGDGFDWFFKAMALARTGRPEPARGWYDRAAEWTDRHDALDGELARLRAEAAALLGDTEGPNVAGREAREAPGRPGTR